MCACSEQDVNIPDVSSLQEETSIYYIKYVYVPKSETTTTSANITYTNEMGRKVDAHGGRLAEDFYAGPVKKGFIAQINFSIRQKNAFATCYIYVSKNGAAYSRVANTGLNRNSGSVSYRIY